MSRVELEGRGLFGGAISRVVLTRTELDHVRVSVAGSTFVRADDLRVLSTVRTTTVGCGCVKLALVEHLFAALAAASVRSCLDVEVSTGELPLLDGGAALWCAALAKLGLDGRADLARDAAWLTKDQPRLRILEAGNVEVGDSEYRFALARGIAVEVDVDFDDARVARSAHWDGTPQAFSDRIASARTFLRFADADAMLAAGLAAEVDPKSVVVLAGDAIHAAGRAFEADEPARHKLLDLLGDLYVHGGPPFGTVSARRPGHAATHRAIAVALDRGILGAW
ncbi:MAG: UDP-3-O-[3-hydroxymyristoyl] N-acetylglucosamine deacetylase [Myxococcaceae bacterium]|nr:UDP-3-O-[3-hydroxymyristoyl] N-acetylglucosamine deacetylase [Myxococcaceae bacterium]